MAQGQAKIKVIDTFYGGQARDDKSTVPGSALNMEEIDIFSNKDYFQAEQIVSSDSLPASTEIYAYDCGDDDTMYAYGRKTSATAGTVRLLSVASSSATNPTTFSTLFTSADTTNLATRVGDLKFFRTTEANPTSLYYIQGTGSSWYLSRYNIGAAAEQTYNGSAWTAGTGNASSQLSGLNGSFDRPTMKVIFGELFIIHNTYIAKVDKDGVFTEKAFTMPLEWQAIDIIPVSDVGLILARNRNKGVNMSKGFWWDLSLTAQFDDSFNIPMGGPQWIVNHKENIIILCAINGTARLFRLSGPFPGAFPVELPGLTILNIGTELTTTPISAPKMVSTKDKILYFGLFKTDKTGIFALGQLDGDKPFALLLSKRFNTTDYSLHTPTAMIIQGPNYFASYKDNGSETSMRCHSLNSPTRSSNAVYESLWVDGGEPFRKKTFQNVIVVVQPLVASTAVACAVRVDFGASYVTITRDNATSLNTTSAVVGAFGIPTGAVNNFANSIQMKLALTSSGSSSPKVQMIMLEYIDGKISYN